MCSRQCDSNGKRNSWETVVNIPFIDERAVFDGERVLQYGPCLTWKSMLCKAYICVFRHLGPSPSSFHPSPLPPFPPYNLGYGDKIERNRRRMHLFSRRHALFVCWVFPYWPGVDCTRCSLYETPMFSPSGVIMLSFALQPLPSPSPSSCRSPSAQLCLTWTTSETWIPWTVYETAREG